MQVEKLQSASPLTPDVLASESYLQIKARVEAKPDLIQDDALWEHGVEDITKKFGKLTNGDENKILESLANLGKLPPAGIVATFVPLKESQFMTFMFMKHFSSDTCQNIVNAIFDFLKSKNTKFIAEANSIKEFSPALDMFKKQDKYFENFEQVVSTVPLLNLVAELLKNDIDYTLKFQTLIAEAQDYERGTAKRNAILDHAEGLQAVVKFFIEQLPGHLRALLEEAKSFNADMVDLQKQH